MAVFEAESRESFIEQMVARIEEQFPETYQRLGLSGAMELINHALQKAADHSIQTRGAVQILIELMLDFGNEFQRSPDRQWALGMLRHPTLPDEIKLMAMRQRMTSSTQGRRLVQV